MSAPVGTLARPRDLMVGDLILAESRSGKGCEVAAFVARVQRRKAGFAVSWQGAVPGHRSRQSGLMVIREARRPVTVLRRAPYGAPAVTVLVGVTGEDIAGGVPGASCACPIRIAIGRALPHLQYIRVAAESVMLSLAEDVPGSWVALPLVARGFVYAYDGARPVEPFGFELAVPGWLTDPEAAPDAA
jgi:hypothetical protein